MAIQSLEWATTQELLNELQARHELIVFAATNRIGYRDTRIVVYAQGEQFGCESLARHLAEYLSIHVMDQIIEGDDDGQ